MAKKASPNYTGFRPSKPVDTADFERIRLAFRAPLNSQRSLKEDPAKVLERLLDERVPVDGKKKTKGEVIVGHLISLADGDRAASKLLDGFLARQSSGWRRERRGVDARRYHIISAAGPR